MNKMLNLATKSLHQMVGTFESKADQIDHDIRPQVTDLLSAIYQGVSLGNFHQGRNQWK